MYSKSLLVAALAGLLSTATAAPAERSSKFPVLKASSVSSFSIYAWGPLEKDGRGDAIILDPTSVSKAQIQNYNSKGKATICYISAGTKENWRADASKFSSSDLANKYKGFGGKETWIDITRWTSVKPIMTARMKVAADKGCKFMEFDNLDCDINRCVPGVSDATLRSKQSEYINWLINTAHGMGMGVGFKNALTHLDKFSSRIQFAINESCQKWNECHYYKPLSSKGKAIFGVEYNNNGGNVCSEARKHKMITKYQHNGKWSNCFSY